MTEYVRKIKTPLKRLNRRLGRLDIELTERCNNDCLHCCINLPAGDPEAMAREMSSARIKKILAEAAGLGCLQVRFTGGEPLLRPDFEEIYLFARRLGLKVLIFTNATLITPNMADLFAKVPPRTKIEITVYGMHAVSYEAVTRQPGSFARFRRGVELLLTRQVPFVLKAALLPQNRQELDEFEAWAKTVPWMDKRPNYAMFFDLRSRRDDEQKNILIKSLRHPPEEGLAIITREEVKYRQGTAEFATKFMCPPGDRLFRCGAGKSIAIDAYGRAQPCLGVRAPALCVDLFASESSTPLADALNHFSSLRDIRSQNPAYLERCAKCFLKGLCAQCPAKAWAEYGTLDTPVEYFCRMAHAEARFMGWLAENEEAWAVNNWQERVGKK